MDFLAIFWRAVQKRCDGLANLLEPCRKGALVGQICRSRAEKVRWAGKFAGKSANPWRRERKRGRAMSRAVLSSSSQRSMKRPSGKHIHKTHTTAGIPREEGMTPATPPLGPTEPQHKFRQHKKTELFDRAILSSGPSKRIRAACLRAILSSGSFYLLLGLGRRAACLRAILSSSIYY